MSVNDYDAWTIHTAGAYFTGWNGTPTIHVIAQHDNLTIAFDMTPEEAIQLCKMLNVDCAYGCFMHQALANQEIQIAFSNNGYASSLRTENSNDTLVLSLE